MADNSTFDMTAVSLKPALEVAFSRHQATHYKTTNNKLYFAWHASAGKDYIPFLVPLTSENAEQVVRQWLKDSAEYPNEPDIDGSCSRSWRIYNGPNWDHVDEENFYVFAAIEPAWAMHGK